MELIFEITDEKDVRFLHFSTESTPDFGTWPEKKKEKFRLVEIHFSGENQNDHHGSKHTGTNPGKLLKFVDMYDTHNGLGRKITIEQKDESKNVKVSSVFQFFNGIPVIRSWTEVVNEGEQSYGMEYVSSFALTGIDKEGISSKEEKVRIHVPHNTWFGEAQWKSYKLSDLGFYSVNEFSMKRLSYHSTGTWSTSQYAPVGFVENIETGTGLMWQIEHNGSWHWEISDMSNLLYLQLSGPTEQENQWYKELKPGESFVSVPVAAGAINGNIEKAIQEMNEYRRKIRRNNEDNLKLPVIFNDYMNCLFGDPTTEKLIPLIDAAAEAGCEYYCIDCGWYSDGFWWDGVGEWLPSEDRFPNGIKEVIDYIRARGMVPGLWLELEVMGINCKLVDEVPSNWFFHRHGKKVIDHSRYQLDFRNDEVIQFADSVIERLVEDYGVGYIKMDYNINAGVGTELGADSFGDGLLEHNRAYLHWLDRIFEKYPDLVIENCGSGGMRMDYALLSRHSIQSSSDQTDYLKNGVIAAASSSLVTPEQCAVWSYPLREGDREEVIFNMINSMLVRIHQSGHLAEITGQRFELIKEGINYYKKIRKDISNGKPFWPLGLPNFEDDWVSFGITNGNSKYIAVWRLDGDKDIKEIPIPSLQHSNVYIKVGYPLEEQNVNWNWNQVKSSLSVQLPSRKSARLFEITVN
ncbi:alpha-galactosidase [Halobacillus salinarum]|uniref:Alpha-galactosidase n=1 Tax=Halobacillus salinarum TaxID=2932257 RepID=A0ABY4EHW0_9BACI|nr:glycoside hydrolase family 36 protein [Halobacillus salinarum]UOQ44050.1 alpha-galactosidase [Halobacillus salinarum]